MSDPKVENEFLRKKLLESAFSKNEARELSGLGVFAVVFIAVASVAVGAMPFMQWVAVLGIGWAGYRIYQYVQNKNVQEIHKATDPNN